MINGDYNREAGSYNQRPDFPIEEDTVQKADNSPFYWLGSSVGTFLRALNTSPNVESLKGPASSMRANLVYFAERFGALSLSKTSAENLILVLDNLFFSQKEDEAVPASVQEARESLTSDQQNRIMAAIISFQAVLSSELGQANVYFVSNKRAYDTTVLLNDGQWLLSIEAWAGLDWSRHKVSQDIREGARCLALNIPTAVGFHFYRAVEAVIVDEYFPLFAIVNPRNRNLGKYISILEKFDVDKRIRIELDHLRECYRNPISHPEIFWNQQQAETATGIAIAVIELMAQDILRRKTEYFPQKRADNE